MNFRRPALFELVMFAVSVACGSAHGGTHEFPIHAFGVTDTIIKLSVDDDVLVPSLIGTPLTEANIQPVLPYPGTPESLAVKASILEHKDLTLGSTPVYFYIATTLAFDRIYRNLILFDRDVSKEIPGATSNGALFANFRNLAQLRPISHAVFSLEVYSNRARFDKRASEIGLHSPRAFWDAEKSTIGLYFDSEIFRWVRFQSAVTGQLEAEVAVHIRDYVSRRVIDTIAHEIIHFIQEHSGTRMAKYPFFAELVAVFIQENIYLREERSLIAFAHTSRGLPLRPWLKQCAALWSGIPPWSVETLRRLPRAVDDLRAGNISFEKIVNLDDATFYSERPDRLAEQYTLFNPFGAFIMNMDKDEFSRRFSKLIDGTGPALVEGLDAAFSGFVQERAVKADQALFDTIDKLVTICLDQRDFISAHTGALRMVELEPEKPRGVIYMGDVFFNSQNAFFALDYYDMAYRMVQADGNAGERILAISRLADAFELLGDVELATRRLKEIENANLSSLSFDLSVMLLRSRLKLAFYSYAEQRNKRPQDISPILVEMYVHAFQGMRCATKAERAGLEAIASAMAKGDDQTARDLLFRQFEFVRREMLEELSQPDWNAVLNSRRANCQ
jgi:hypothetical protein